MRIRQRSNACMYNLSLTFQPIEGVLRSRKRSRTEGSDIAAKNVVDE